MGERGRFHIGLSKHYSERLFDSMSRPPITFVHVGFKKKKWIYARSHRLTNLQFQSVNLG